MKRFAIAAFVVALVATPAMAADTITFNYAEKATVIDPSGDLADVDFSVAEPDRMATKVGLGTWMTKERMNEITTNTGKLGVVTFNGSDTAGEYRPNKIVQYYDPDDARRVEFTVVQGLGNYENGYNYGGYDSSGRVAISGSDANNHMGTIPGDSGGASGSLTNLCAFDVALVGARAASYVQHIGGVVIGKTTAATQQGPTMIVTIEDLVTEVQSTATMIHNGWCGGSVDTNALFFGYKAPDGSKIVRVSFDQTFIGGPPLGGVFGAFDDLTFSVAPEPGTMVLLGLGGLGMLIRRKRS